MMIIKIDAWQNYNLTCQLLKGTEVVLEDVTQTRMDTKFIMATGSTIVSSTSTFKAQCQGNGSTVVTDAQIIAIRVDTIN